ncbi:MAG: hypothetical protein Q4G16_04430 [Cruoricaptor ignavus]|nr:hypothetical protein [Cruoricaptor ignavus]
MINSEQVALKIIKRRSTKKDYAVYFLSVSVPQGVKAEEAYSKSDIFGHFLVNYEIKTFVKGKEERKELTNCVLYADEFDFKDDTGDLAKTQELFNSVDDGGTFVIFKKTIKGKEKNAQIKEMLDNALYFIREEIYSEIKDVFVFYSNTIDEKIWAEYGPKFKKIELAEGAGESSPKVIACEGDMDNTYPVLYIVLTRFY